MGKRRTRHVLLPVLSQRAHDDKLGRRNAPRGEYAFEHEGKEANTNCGRKRIWADDAVRVWSRATSRDRALSDA